MATTPRSIVNAITHPDQWLLEMERSMDSRQEILLLTSALPEAKMDELVRLCNAREYHPPNPVPRERWDDYKPRLSLTDFAAKEQGMINMVIYVLRPR